MEVTLPRSALAQRLQLVSGVIPSRAHSNTLTFAKLTADKGGRCTLEGSSIEVHLKANLDQADVATPGECLLPPQRLNAILRESSDEMIRIFHEKGKLIITGERDEYKLQVELAEDFPVKPNREAKSIGTLRADQLDAVLARLISATDPESNRYALGGVYCETDIEAKRADWVAADGHRMHHCLVAWADWEGPKPEPSIIPRKAVPALRRVLSSDEVAMVRCDFSHNDVRFETEQWEFMARLVEGRYPQWRSVFPNNERDIDIPAGVLLTSVRKAEITATIESRAIDLAFTTGQLTITNATADIGSSRVEIPVSYPGEDIRVCLDSRFVREYLSVLPPAENVTVSLGEKGGAVVFTAGSYKGVVMPLEK